MRLIALLIALTANLAFGNDFYNASGAPSTGAPIVSSTIRNEFANIGAGFNKMPPLTGNGNQVVLVNAGGTGLTVALATALPNMAIGTNLEAWSAQLDALSALATTGLIARTAANTVTTRTLTGTAAEITVTNGDGVAGAPTLSLPASLTFTGKTITGGTFSGPTLTTATVNGNTFTTGSYTLTGTAAKILTFSNTLTLAGTDGTTLTFQGTDTYVGRATTDTLTNKTHTNPANTDQTLTDASTINWDMSLGGIATVTLGAAGRTMAAPTNMKKGTYILHVLQDGTGNRTITTWNAVFKWPGAVAPTLSTGASKRDIITFISDGTNMYGPPAPLLDVR